MLLKKGGFIRVPTPTQKNTDFVYLSPMPHNMLVLFHRNTHVDLKKKKEGPGVPVWKSLLLRICACVMN